MFFFRKNKQEPSLNKLALNLIKLDNKVCLTYKIESGQSLSISKWIVSEGDFVEKGQPILELNTYNGYSELPSPENGYIEILYESIYSKKLTNSDLIFSIYQNDEERLNKRYQNEIEISHDDFTKKSKVGWKNIGAPKIEDEPYYKNILSSLYKNKNYIKLTNEIGISIENNTGYDYLILEYSKNEYKFKSNDEFSIKFEDGTILVFQLLGNPKVKVHQLINRFEIPILYAELKLLTEKKIDKFRFDLKETRYQFEIDRFDAYTSWYSSKKDFQFVFQSVFNDYTYAVASKLENYIPLYSRELEANSSNINQEDRCYVYLMIDLTNNYHKIGISSSPVYREKTLQSEKPTIELLCSKEFPKRKSAEIAEKTLHAIYNERRIRGEWFKLSDDEVDDITKFLK